MIDSFSGDYAFLSNFYPSPIIFPEGDEEFTAPTAEHFFQYHKTPSMEEGIEILIAPTPGKAKRLGKTCYLRKDWEDAKVQVMHKVLRMKFTQHPDLAQKLLATGDEFLVEGNSWNDTFWGVCDGKGRNMLGFLLMEVREELKNECK